MGLFEAVARGWSGWSDFEGRASRAEYWLWQLFLALGLMCVAVLAGALEGLLGIPVQLVFGGGGLLFLIAILVPGLALLVRRLHDIGASGWFVLISFIPYLGGLIIFVMTVWPGTRGDNAYGPDSCNPTLGAEEHF